MNLHKQKRKKYNFIVKSIKMLPLIYTQSQTAKPNEKNVVYNCGTGINVDI